MHFDVNLGLHHACSAAWWGCVERLKIPSCSCRDQCRTTYPRWWDLMCVGAAGLFRHAMWPEDRIRILLGSGFAGNENRSNCTCRHMSAAGSCMDVHAEVSCRLIRSEAELIASNKSTELWHPSYYISLELYSLMWDLQLSDGYTLERSYDDGFERRFADGAQGYIPMILSMWLTLWRCPMSMCELDYK
jgi:hypothetical protein